MMDERALKGGVRDYGAVARTATLRRSASGEAVEGSLGDPEGERARKRAGGGANPPRPTTLKAQGGVSDD